MEVRTLRLLLIHADKFEYESKEKAVKEPEILTDHAKKGVLQDGLVVFTTVEKGDEASPESTAANAAASITRDIPVRTRNEGIRVSSGERGTQEGPDWRRATFSRICSTVRDRVGVLC